MAHFGIEWVFMGAFWDRVSKMRRLLVVNESQKVYDTNKVTSVTSNEMGEFYFSTMACQTTKYVFYFNILSLVLYIFITQDACQPQKTQDCQLAYHLFRNAEGGPFLYCGLSQKQTSGTRNT